MKDPRIYLFRLGYPVVRFWYRLTKPRHQGVRAVVWHAGNVLLVRESYGQRRWNIPGGYLKRGEIPEHAARRELREETGVAPVERVMRFAGTTRTVTRYGLWEVWIYEGNARSDTIQIDNLEIMEGGWFDPAALPHPRSRYVEEILNVAGTLSGR